MADGSITFSTDLDNKQLEQKLAEAKEEIKDTEKQLNALEKERSNAIRKQESAYSDLQKKQEQYAASLEKVRELEQERSYGRTRIHSLKESGLNEQRIMNNEVAFWGREDLAAKQSTKYMEARENLTRLIADYKQQLAYIQQINAEISKAKSAEEQHKQAVAEANQSYRSASATVQTLDSSISSVQASLASAESTAGSFAQQLQEAQEQAQQTEQATQTLKTPIEKAATGVDRFVNRIKRIALNAFVFNLVSKGFQAIVSRVKDAIAADEEASAAMARLKGAMLTMIQPIISFVVPVLTTLANVLTRIIALVGNLFGKSFLADNAKAAQALDEQANAIDGVGSAAKDAQKQLMGFDELNTLSDDSSSGSSGGSSGGTSDASYDFDTGMVTDKLDELAVYVAGALLAVGALLAFSGINIPLGLGLMALGAVAMAAVIKENWDSMDGKVGDAITKVLLVLGAAALIIGAILTFSGTNIALGIGLMIAGAAALGAAVVLNWDTIENALKGPIGKITALVSGAFLVLGAILALTGVNLPLGIGLMVAGAAGLAVVAVVNWDTMGELIKNDISAIATAVSVALLALGAMLAFSGANIPLGIALIVAGAAGLVTVTALNWNAITDKIRDVWQGIKNFWNQYIAPVFTTAFWKEKFGTIKEGLTSKIKDGINAAIGLFNTFIGWVNQKMNFSWGGLSIAGKQLVEPGSLQLFTIPSIPYLAQGAVIPPNREFLAVLGDQKHGTNIEAPLDTIKQAVAEVLAQNGGGGEQEIIINFTGSLSQLGRVLAPEITRQQRQTQRVKGV